MRKIALAIATFVAVFAFVSCGSNPDAQIKKQADDMFAQAEKDIQAVDNMADFYAYMSTLEDNKAVIAQSMMEQYSTDGENALVPDDVTDYIYNRATAYNVVEGEKYAELMAPYLDRVENALNAIQEQGISDLRMKEYNEALDDMMEYLDYDNIPLDTEKKVEAIFSKMGEIDLVPEIQ